MSGNIIPLTPQPQGGALTQAPAPALPQAWTQGPPPPPPSARTPPLVRYMAVLRRFRWLILLLVVLGTAGGLVATRFIEPTYDVSATIWINSETPVVGEQGGPGQANALVETPAWPLLLRSPFIAEEVVRRLALYVTPEEPADSVLFRGFRLADPFQPGPYALIVEPDGKRWRLVHNEATIVDRGAVGDSVGVVSRVGFQWLPDASLLTPDRHVRFIVTTPRDAAVALSSQLQDQIQVNLLQLTLTGPDRKRTEQILNTWMEVFVESAMELKRSGLVQFANNQRRALDQASEQMRNAELALQQFKVGTITLPNETTPINAGTTESSPTVQSNYFAQRMEADRLRQAREIYQQILTEAQASGRLSQQSLVQLELMTAQVSATGLRQAIQRYHEVVAQRSTLLAAGWTENSDPIKDVDRQLTELASDRIPNQARVLLAQLGREEQRLEQQLAGAERQLRAIPQRSQREAELTRDAQLSAGIYSELASRTAAADLAARSVVSDISILSPAAAPLLPSGNQTWQILLAAVLGSLGLGIVLAFLIDRMDQRFRYPEQAKDDLGLDILGAVPRLVAAKKGREDPEESMRVLEAFRLIRLNVRNALDEPESLALAVSSPAAGDGKSLVSSNLAISFAEAGYRTLLIDGDIRRGALHVSFELPQRPGLSELLGGAASRADVIRQTAVHRNLSVISCGKRTRQAPELLSSATMTELLAQVRQQYDVVIVDSPPLSAGIDPYALGTATGNMIVVLRAGETNMRLAQAKLQTLDRLPVFLLGAVLNGIQAKGVYEYYSYEYGYAADDEDDEVLPVAAAPAAAPQLTAESEPRRPE